MGADFSLNRKSVHCGGLGWFFEWRKWYKHIIWYQYRLWTMTYESSSNEKSLLALPMQPKPTFLLVLRCYCPNIDIVPKIFKSIWTPVKMHKKYAKSHGDIIFMLLGLFDEFSNFLWDVFCDMFSLGGRRIGRSPLNPPPSAACSGVAGRVGPMLVFCRLQSLRQPLPYPPIAPKMLARSTPGRQLPPFLWFLANFLPIKNSLKIIPLQKPPPNL